MKRAMLPMLGPRAVVASVSRYRVVQVDIRAPFDKDSQRFTRWGPNPFDRVRGLDALPRWDPPSRHPRLALNTM